MLLRQSRGLAAQPCRWHQRPAAVRLAALRLHPCRASGSAGDDVSSKLDSLKQAAEKAAADVQSTSSNVAGSVKDAVAAASNTAADLGALTKDAVMQLAKDAASAVDGLVSDLSTSIAAAKRDASSSSKAASVAFDGLVASLIQKSQGVKDVLVHSNTEAAAKVDTIIGSFASTATGLRKEASNRTLSWDVAFDRLQTAMVSTGTELKQLVVDVAAAGSGMSAKDVTAQLPAAPAPSAAGSSSSGGLGVILLQRAQLLISLATLYYLDQGIKVLFTQYAVKFPSALAGMFGVFVLLCGVGDKAADGILGWYNPALNWIARWLPLFYVPALVTLPLALNGIPGADLLRIVGILSVGMVATLMFTAQITVAIREAVKTPVKEIAKAKPSPPFETSHYVSWGLIAAGSLAATVFAGGSLGAQMALPFGLAATVGGYLLGCLVPKGLQGVFHPVLVTAVVANAGVALHGALMGLDYNTAQKVYLAKGAGPLGAGDALMALLGVVIISFGFRVYTQRDTMKRHAPEIFGATILSALFSLFSTAFAAKAIGLSSALARALIPRSVTVALALPIAQGLEAPLAITAAAVLLQGILGANFGPNLMTKFGVKDTIARGLAAAGTAGGLGTASLTSKEPEALPFCALSYAMVGIFSTVVMSVPAVRDLVIAIVG